MTPGSSRTFQHHAMLLRGTTCAGTSGPHPVVSFSAGARLPMELYQRRRVSYTYGTPVCVHRPFLHTYTNDPSFCPCVPFLPVIDHVARRPYWIRPHRGLVLP